MFSGQKLKNIRKEAGYTQVELAKLLGISRETVINIERENPVTMENLPMELTKKWWMCCAKRVSASSQLSFQAKILQFFGF